MSLTRTPSGSFVLPLCVLSGLLLVSGLVVSWLPEPPGLAAAGPAPVAPELVEAAEPDQPRGQ